MSTIHLTKINFENLFYEVVLRLFRMVTAGFLGLELYYAQFAFYQEHETLIGILVLASYFILVIFGFSLIFIILPIIAMLEKMFRGTQAKSLIDHDILSDVFDYMTLSASFILITPYFQGLYVDRYWGLLILLFLEILNFAFGNRYFLKKKAVKKFVD